MSIKGDLNANIFNHFGSVVDDMHNSQVSEVHVCPPGNVSSRERPIIEIDLTNDITSTEQYKVVEIDITCKKMSFEK